MPRYPAIRRTRDETGEYRLTQTFGNSVLFTEVTVNRKRKWQQRQGPRRGPGDYPLLDRIRAGGFGFFSYLLYLAMLNDITFLSIYLDYLNLSSFM
jgi:hypothetical protein